MAIDPNSVNFKPIDELTQKAQVTGNEKIPVSDTEYITPSQITEGLESGTGTEALIAAHNTSPEAHEDIREAIADVETNVLKFKGYVSLNEPPSTLDLQDGDLWYKPASAESKPDLSFPWMVRTYADKAWGDTLTEFTPSTLDVCSNLDAVETADTEIPVKTSYYAKGAIAETPLQIAFDRLTFAIVKNTANDMASICMKSTSGNTIAVLFSMTAWYGGATQSATALQGVNDEWAVIDNDAGFSNGGAHRIIVLDTENQDMYDITTSVTGNGTSNAAVIGAIYGRILTK